MRRQLEDNLQIAAMGYLRLQYPAALCFHVANERQTSKMRGAKLKRMGVLAGVSDILIMQARGAYFGACIELKAPKGRETDSQKRFINRAGQAGYMVAVCWSFDQFKKVVDLYFSQPETKVEPTLLNTMPI